MESLKSLFETTFVIVLLGAGLRAATPLLLAAVGEAYSERAGQLNLGIEGMMLAGAFTGFLVALNTNSLVGGFVVGTAVGALLGLVFAFFTVTLRLDQIVIGLGLTILVGGVTSFLFRYLFGHRFPSLFISPENIAIPLLSQMPILGEAVFRQQFVVYLAILLLPVTHFVFHRTRMGLALRAAGENPVAADASGIDVFRVRYQASVVGGSLAGLGGAFLSIGDLAFFIPQMTMGQGFLAIAIAMLGKWEPFRIFIGALLFGMTLALATGLQITRIQVEPEFILVLPYVGMIFALLLLARHTVLPAALGRPYER